MTKTLVAAAIALLIGSMGGAVFAFAGLPLPWTLGSLTASAIAAVAYNRWPMPTPVRNLARPVVGVLAGSAFTPEIAALMLEWWPAVLSVTLYSAVVTLIGYLVFTRGWRLDAPTAFFAAAPGGLAEMTLAGSGFGGAARTIALFHTIRIVAVVFVVPFALQIALGQTIVRMPMTGDAAGVDLAEWLILFGAGVAGYALARYARFPGGEMVAAMFCSALLHGFGLVHAAPPGWLVIFAQILIGSVAGARFAGLRWLELRTTIVRAVVWAAFLLATAGALAALIAGPLGIDPVTMLLALAPGGTAEMIIVTFALGGEVALVSVCQVIRVLLVLTLVPLSFRQFTRRGPPGGTAGT
jgi:membrane AbrB-like protein